MTRTNFKTGLWIVLGLYFIVLIKLTFFKNVLAGIKYYRPPHARLKDRLEFANFVPLRNIKQFIVRGEGLKGSLEHLSPARQIEFVSQNLVGNVVMFIPLGILIPCLFESTRSFGKVIIISFLTSFAIECTQLLTSRGFFDVDDMILNTLGGIIGFFVYKKFISKNNFYLQSEFGSKEYN